MKYVYKIHSGFDGFTPACLPDRMAGNVVPLGWKRYVDTVEPGDEIWVYFHGPQKYANGVYAKGIAKEVQYEERTVLLSITEHDTRAPLTDPEMSARVATVVKTRYQQVFVLPEELDRVPVCTVATAADSCAARHCSSCPAWRSLPLVQTRILNIPHRLSGHVDVFVPAYWVIPNRSFLYKGGKTIRRGVRRSSELFMRYKTGEANLAHALALGMRRALARANSLEADAIVPVPLSPDKAKRNELHRTLHLARELSHLMGVPVRQWLTLTQPVSKRSLRTGLGYGAASFEDAYREQLTVAPGVSGAERIIVVDDVCTEGSTLRTCGDVLKQQRRDLFVVAATAGQMTMKQVVGEPNSLWENP